MSSLRHGLFLVAELALKLCVMPRLRARLIGLLGGTIGTNVRIYNCTFINLSKGFSNLSVGEDVHIGADCLIDLEGQVSIGKGSTLSPRVTVISHADPGSAHSSPLTLRFPPTRLGVRIGDHVWIGATSTILDGTSIGDLTVVGAGSLVRGELSGGTTYAGVPVRSIQRGPQAPLRDRTV